MSSNQSNTQSRKIKSIRTRLATRMVWMKIGAGAAKIIAVFIAIAITWLLALEYANVGNIYFIKRNHDFVLSEEYDSDGLLSKLKNTEYVISDAVTKEVMMRTTPFEHIDIFFVFFLGFLGSSFILNWMSFPIMTKRVKDILAPLDELTQKADEITKFDFSEDKYHMIEDQIDSLEPDDEKLIHLDDEDLSGIERAMNSLVARIKENNRQQARFVNDASHELRTPIAVIQGYANMLARWGREDEKVLDESITAIQNESENMKRLVEQLLFLARGDSGRTQLNKERVNLNEMMREVYEESLMIDENHVYKLTVPTEPVYADVDEGLIKQSVRILVDNAAKYTSEKDEIILGVGTDSEGKKILKVQDSGIGMKEADVEHMFERFYRADKARTYNGTGLGLSIAKWIVDKHEGHFEIVSREDLGTRICIYLN